VFDATFFQQLFLSISGVTTQPSTMLRVRSARGGPEEEPSDDYILEGEYEKLKRSYRVMQNDYHRYKEDCQRLLKKQK